MGVAISYFTQQGWTVSIPLTDSQSYDLVVDNGNDLQKVQVKWTGSLVPPGVYQVDLRSTGGNQSRLIWKHFDPAQCDLLFVATELGDRYLIPVQAKFARSLTLGAKYANFKI